MEDCLISFQMVICWSTGVTQAPLVLILFSSRAGLGLCEAHIPLLLLLDFQRGGLHPGSTCVCIRMWYSHKGDYFLKIKRNLEHEDRAGLSQMGNNLITMYPFIPLLTKSGTCTPNLYMNIYWAPFITSKFLTKAVPLDFRNRSAGPKNITMDMIFRSSSRFKKAKLSALGDSETQPVDYVPDSQANAWPV